MTDDFRYFATTAKSLEPLAAAELQEIGAKNIKLTQGGVHFQGPLATAYRFCLWSRVANRLLLRLGQFAVEDPEQLYQGVSAIAWAEHFVPHSRIMVDFVGHHETIRHSRFGAQKCKDAICDQFLSNFGTRPDVDTAEPQIRINVHLSKGEATVALDLSGAGLHRRGYRLQSVAAPLRETVAAAALLRARWPQYAGQGLPLVDPMCGSGTLLIEGAMLAGDIAPGLQRAAHGFEHWLGHDPVLWQQLTEEAGQRKARGLSRIPPVLGFDVDADAVHSARENIRRAGLEQYVTVERQDISACKPPAGIAPGLVATNPPYGERLGRESDLPRLYRQLGDRLKQEFVHWKAAVLTNQKELGRELGMRARRINKLFNGPIECLLLHFDIEPRWFLDETARSGEPKIPIPEQLSPGAQMLANRLKKNRKHLRRWAEKENVACYRIYDADLPEYALAVDLYHGEKLWICLQEYAAPKHIDPQKTRARLQDAMAAVLNVFAIPREQLFIKTRRRQRHLAQYEKLSQREHFEIVPEYNCRFYVNFTDYLDTGLFLDHRQTRLHLQQLAGGKRVLNLFAYTGAASVHAAMGGARVTTSVDLSATYLQWARRNFELNGLDLRDHQFIQADCLQWLTQRRAEKYDLIFLDPPTFSTSKRMQQAFDIQREHRRLIGLAMKQLRTGGLLIFSTNFRKFSLDPRLQEHYAVNDISAQTLPRDFARNPKIHHCWEIREKTR